MSSNVGGYPNSPVDNLAYRGQTIRLLRQVKIKTQEGIVTWYVDHLIFINHLITLELQCTSVMLTRN